MLRRLLPLGLVLCLWGCGDSAPPRHGGAGGLSDEAQVAQLLDDNVPFEFDFDLEGVNGQRLSKADFAGKVLIVDIWGTWCPPCRMEVPHFVALKTQFGDQGLEIVGLNEEQIRDKEAAARTVREYCSTVGVNYPCALITREVKRQIPDYGNFPTTLFLDRKGNVRLMVVGYHALPFLQAAAETLLKEQPPDSARAPAETDAQPDDHDGQ